MRKANCQKNVRDWQHVEDEDQVVAGSEEYAQASAVESVMFKGASLPQEPPEVLSDKNIEKELEENPDGDGEAEEHSSAQEAFDDLMLTLTINHQQSKSMHITLVYIYIINKSFYNFRIL